MKVKTIKVSKFKGIDNLEIPFDGKTSANIDVVFEFSDGNCKEYSRIAQEMIIPVKIMVAMLHIAWLSLIA